MNILEAEDIIKGLPDQSLMEEAQAPSGQVPQFLVVSEIQRRTDMRKRYQDQQQPQGTVTDQIVQEGIMGAMPPQPMMPQAMPPQAMPPQAMPPQAMPPQQMFSGGIIRLQGGGSTSMPGAGALEPIMYAIQERAKDIARITGRKFEEVYETLLRQAQEQNPDYSMIAPAGLGISMDDLPSLPEGAGSNFPEMFQSGRDVNAQLASLPSLPNATLDMPTREEARAADRARVASIREGISPLGTYGSTPEEFEAQRGRFSLPEGVSSAFDAIFGVPERPDYEVAGEVATVRPFKDTGIDPAKSDLPELSEAIVTAQQLSPDASRKGAGILYEEDGIETLLRGGPKEVQGTSPRQAQAVPDPGKTDALDFSDLIKESKDAAMANALMQLGAGIAGGDVSKGISAAGIAATKGQQDAKTIAIQQRLAEYQSGREDLARREKADQFDRQMTALETRYANELAKAASVGRNELFRTVTSLVEAAMEGSSEFDPAKREAMVQAMMKKYLSAYAPAFDVDPEAVSFGMQEPSGARTPEQIKAIYGV
jgi:hypothetical protein